MQLAERGAPKIKTSPATFLDAGIAARNAGSAANGARRIAGNRSPQKSPERLETYTLAAGGTMLVSVVRPEHNPFTLVFRRK